MIDWHGMFAFDTPVLEIIIRGTCVYWALFLIMRFWMRRGSGSVGVTDLLVIVLLGDAIQNAMAGDYNSISDGILLVVVIVAWDYILDFLAYHVPFMRKFLVPEKICLVKNGKLQWDNMKPQLITEEELLSQLRLNEALSVSKVKEAYLEPNGEISVITKE
ncbi:MAG TPA: YetF domain-containing protein [Alphaproteobacteria bacterium]